MSAITNQLLNGTAAQTASAGTSESIGAITNRNRFDFVGTTISLSSILITSANGWSKPFGPTRFGPILRCIQPRILRSQYVKYATDKISGTSTTTILTSTTIRNWSHAGTALQIDMPCASNESNIATPPLRAARAR